MSVSISISIVFCQVPVGPPFPILLLSHDTTPHCIARLVLQLPTTKRPPRFRWWSGCRSFLRVPTVTCTVSSGTVFQTIAALVSHSFFRPSLLPLRLLHTRSDLPCLVPSSIACLVSALTSWQPELKHMVIVHSQSPETNPPLAPSAIVCMAAAATAAAAPLQLS